MIFFISNDKDSVVNRSVIKYDNEVSYPFFDNVKIDSYISHYLSNNVYDKYLIDYDLYLESNDYYLTFYKYIFNGNKISYDVDSFLVNVKKSSIDYIDNKNKGKDIIIKPEENSSKKYVALTFDDGPNYNTNKILDILDKYKVKATFFVLGSRVSGNEYILKRMNSMGMVIGNHTFNHLLLTKYSEDKIRSEIEDTNRVIFDTVGAVPTLLRPSYGSVNNKIKKVSNMPIIIWDVDTLDWKYHNSKTISSRVINKVRDGDIVLMHDIYSASANALDIIIPKLINNGYTFVTVPELFYYKGIELENGKVYGFAR